MKILLFEWLTGGGQRHPGDASERSGAMQCQGLQMLNALSEDFLRAGIEVVVPVAESLGRVLPEHPNLSTIPVGSGGDWATTLLDASIECDDVMLIAPECEDCLIECVAWFDSVERKLISPDLAFVTLASCKIATFRHLHANRFNAFPTGFRLSDYLNCESDHHDFFSPADYPLVLKPVNGAGSEKVKFISGPAAWQPDQIQFPDRFRIETFMTGTPISVSVLCGEICEILAPTIQVFDRQPFGNYVRSAYPIESDLSERAIRLAGTVVKALPPTVGYIGMDMIIRDDRSLPDCLIEVNPRLTLSYLTLRTIYHDNLALAMLNQGARYRTTSSRARNRDCIFRAPDL